MRKTHLAILAVLTLVLAACGGEAADTTTTSAPGTSTTAASETTDTTPPDSAPVAAEEMTDVSLILDFVPGGIHAGIYSALAEGYFEEANLNVDIQPPTSSADTLRLVLADQATIGIAPVGDVASLRAQGEPVQIFLALEQVPLAGLMSTEAIGITDPSQLSGGTVGVTGVPSDEAIARFILESSDVDPSTVEFITIGFDAVANLIGQSVDAAIGFWSAEAVALELEGEEPVVFRPDEYGAPQYPELVFFASDDTVTDDPDVLAAFSDALARGYGFAMDNQEAAIQNLADNADGIDTEFASAEFDNVEPHFLNEEGRFGALEESAFTEYLEWAADVGIIESVPENLLTTEFMP
ncbi:MAG: ABC transporter substrate-binding protein [Actinomycetota bacterium]